MRFTSNRLPLGRPLHGKNIHDHHICSLVLLAIRYMHETRRKDSGRTNVNISYHYILVYSFAGILPLNAARFVLFVILPKSDHGQYLYALCCHGHHPHLPNPWELKAWDFFERLTRSVQQEMVSPSALPPVYAHQPAHNRVYQLRGRPASAGCREKFRTHKKHK
jgi:hypothetical protein